LGVRVPPALQGACGEHAGTGVKQLDRSSATDGDDVTDTRESASPSRPREQRKPLPARISLFYRQVIAELRKVIWPTRKELITYTSVVIVFVLMVIAYVSVLDFGFAKGVLAIFG
jgi:preprotein translocase subunit SecE